MFFSFYLYIGLSRHAVMKSFKSYCDAKAVFHSGRENGKTQEKMPELDCHDQSLFSKSLSLKIHLVSCCLIDFFFLPLLIIERITFSLAEGVKIISIARFHHDYNTRINFDFSYVHLIIPIRF